MKRRTVAGLVSAVLVIGLGSVAAIRPVPYVTFSPGPTVNVLGKFDDEQIIQVSGRQSYRDSGGLRLLTVVPSGPENKVSLAQLVLAWADPDKSVYPYSAIYGTQDTRSSVQQQSTVEMDTSQSDAVAAALRGLKIPFTTYTQIGSVQKDGPADGRLEPGARVISVDGAKIGGAQQLANAIRPLDIGSEVTVVVRRDGKRLTKTMTTTKSPTTPSASALLVTIAPGYDFPFDVKLNIDKNIGGPSGGLMFSLGIYDVLTPGSLTDGKVIAGTGEIDSEGTVSPIGGIQQKLVAAQAAGAKLFLAPADNCAEALGGNFDPKKMRLVRVEKFSDALEDVQSWVEDPGATLPRCTR